MKLGISQSFELRPSVIASCKVITKKWQSWALAVKKGMMITVAPVMMMMMICKLDNQAVNVAQPSSDHELPLLKIEHYRRSVWGEVNCTLRTVSFPLRSSGPSRREKEWEQEKWSHRRCRSSYFSHIMYVVTYIAPTGALNVMIATHYTCMYAMMQGQPTLWTIIMNVRINIWIEKNWIYLSHSAMDPLSLSLFALEQQSHFQSQCAAEPDWGWLQK